MEFHKKLQELRKGKGLTQEQLAERLYVSRTAISKWESGRGYPNIESLKAIAKFFSVTVDEILSSDEVLTIAEADSRQKETHLRDLLYGLLDLCVLMLFFLPIFAQKTGETIQSVSLIMLDGVQPYLKIAYCILVVSTSVTGVLMLLLQNCQAAIWVKSKRIISLLLGAALLLLFMISLQAYASVFVFALLAVKVLMVVNWR